MSRIIKTIMIVIAIIFVPIYLFYAIGFGLQLIGFADAMVRAGLRAALAPPGSSDMDFYASVTWLVLMIISIYIIPILLIISAGVYLLKRKKHIYK